METAHPSEETPDAAPDTMAGVEPVNATVLIGPAAAGYGRHAAPPSAYGPADLHRLLPASLIGSAEPPRDGADEEPDRGVPLRAVVGFDHPARPAAVVVDDEIAARSSRPARDKAAGFWSRLLQLPQAG